MSPLQGHEQQVADFCRRHHIRKLALFGSRVRGDFRRDSDLDVLVEFEEEYTPGLDFFTMQDELSRLVGYDVDLRTPLDIGRDQRSRVIEESEVVYASG